MSLTDTQIKSIKFEDKAVKLSDGKGLYLLVNKTGKYFRYNYRYAGKQKTLALGVYPETSLKKARERLDEARKLLADGIDPSESREICEAFFIADFKQIPSQAARTAEPPPYFLVRNESTLLCFLHLCRKLCYCVTCKMCVYCQLQIGLVQFQWKCIMLIAVYPEAMLTL